MKFCPECGAKVEGMKFCPECGNKLEGDQTKEIVLDSSSEVEETERTILEFSTFMFGLEDKKKSIGGNIDLSLPQYNYTLTSERLFIVKKGYVAAKKEEIELYKIKDVAVKQGLKDKIIGIGNIEIHSVDESTPILLIKQIKNPEEIKEAIRSAVKSAKQKMNMRYEQNI